MPLTTVTSVPADPAIEKLEDRRLWIGNLDSTITEYQLLKILEKHGRMEKFDYLFHRSGPLAGQPRGFAFVTYGTREEAEQMIKKMDGKRIGTKHITVRWAHNINREDYEKPQLMLQLPALIGAKDNRKSSRTSKTKAIEAIQAKLKTMESSSRDEFQLNIASSSSCEVSSELSQTKLRLTRSFNKPYSKRKFY